MVKLAKKTAEDLDKELENYMGNTTDALDQNWIIICMRQQPQTQMNHQVNK